MSLQFQQSKTIEQFKVKTEKQIVMRFVASSEFSKFDLDNWRRTEISENVEYQLHYK